MSHVKLTHYGIRSLAESLAPFALHELERNRQVGTLSEGDLVAFEESSIWESVCLKLDEETANDLHTYLHSAVNEMKAERYLRINPNSDVDHEGEIRVVIESSHVTDFPLYFVEEGGDGEVVRVDFHSETQGWNVVKVNEDASSGLCLTPDTAAGFVADYLHCKCPMMNADDAFALLEAVEGMYYVTDNEGDRWYLYTEAMGTVFWSKDGSSSDDPDFWATPWYDHMAGETGYVPVEKAVPGDDPEFVAKVPFPKRMTPARFLRQYRDVMERTIRSHTPAAV